MRQLCLRAIVQGSLEYVSEPAGRAKYFWGDLLVGHLGRVDSTAWRYWVGITELLAGGEYLDIFKRKSVQCMGCSTPFVAEDFPYMVNFQKLELGCHPSTYRHKLTLFLHLKFFSGDEKWCLYVNMK